MFCPECGNRVTDGAKFCSNCGRALVANESSVGGTIQLRCKSCNGIMHVKEGDNLLYCPYCGAEEMVVDSEDVAIEKIRYKAYADVAKHKQETTKQVELERMKHEREMEEHVEIKESSRQFKKSKLRKWVIAFAIICAIITYSRISDKNFRGALIPGAQTILFLASWILGMGTSKKHWLHRVFALFGFLLIIPFIRYGSGGGALSRTPSKLDWPVTGLATKLPKPDAEYGEVTISFNDLLMVDVEKFSKEQYEDYLSQCKELGFTIEASTTSIGYDAYNEEGYDLSLMYFDYHDGEMSISLNAPMELTDITWPDSGPAILIPVPTSLKGKISSESSTKFVAHIGDISKEEFDKYVSQCKERGFTEDYSKSEKKYKAENADGYQLSVMYEGFNIIEISIYAPENESSGTNGSSTKGTLNTSTSTSVPMTTPMPTNTPAPTDTPLPADNITTADTASVQGVRQEFKEYVDSYEAFYDEYIAFIASYDSSDFTMITKYADFMSKAEEFDQKAESYQDDSDLTSEELKYLLDAQARIQQKLLSVE